MQWRIYNKLYYRGKPVSRKFGAEIVIAKTKAEALKKGRRKAAAWSKKADRFYMAKVVDAKKYK